eukprot:m.303455 g.303455  ORF g.303455 m.303455 type:complete len:692 (-) comp20165_c0_seq4:283-2358(-)
MVNTTQVTSPGEVLSTAKNGIKSARVGTDGDSEDNRTPSTTGFLLLDVKDIDYNPDRDMIGKGQYGQVFRAKWNGPNSLNLKKGNDVAVKLLFNRHDLNEVFGNMEASLLSTLSHKNVVKFHGLAQCGQKTLLITEYCSGGSLYSQIRSGQLDSLPFCVHPESDQQSLLPWALDVAYGVAYLHEGLEEAIAHLDLKSMNVLISSQSVLKICDFGSARPAKDPLTGAYAGTAQWMAPEAINSLQTITVQCDIWSYGIILWELLTLQLPYSGLYPDNPEAILFLVGSGRLQPTIPDEAPEAIRELLRACWSTNPDDRPIASELVKKLEHLQDATDSPTGHAMDEFIQSRDRWLSSLRHQQEKELSEAITLIERTEQVNERLREELDGAKRAARLDRTWSWMVTIGVMILFVFYLEPSHDVDTSVDVDLVFQENTGDNDLVDQTAELDLSLQMLEKKGVIPKGTSWDKGRIMGAYDYKSPAGLDATEFATAIANEKGWYGLVRQTMSRAMRAISGHDNASLGVLFRDIRRYIGPFSLGVLGLLVSAMATRFFLQRISRDGTIGMPNTIPDAAKFTLALAATLVGCMMLAASIVEEVSGLKIAQQTIKLLIMNMVAYLIFMSIATWNSNGDKESDADRVPSTPRSRQVASRADSTDSPRGAVSRQSSFALRHHEAAPWRRRSSETLRNRNEPGTM